MKFEDYPAAAAPPQGVNSCDQCALRRLDAFLPPSGEELQASQSFRVGTRRVEAGSSIIDANLEVGDAVAREESRKKEDAKDQVNA